eukprot:scaffold47252_cov59-Phaeocystis_antarctica.AAC.3
MPLAALAARALPLAARFGPLRFVAALAAATAAVAAVAAAAPTSLTFGSTGEARIPLCCDSGPAEASPRRLLHLRSVACHLGGGPAHSLEQRLHIRVRVGVRVRVRVGVRVKVQG